MIQEMTAFMIQCDGCEDDQIVFQTDTGQDLFVKYHDEPEKLISEKYNPDNPDWIRVQITDEHFCSKCAAKKSEATNDLP